jgi:fucose 4-O-acetylase-like acetyltransferase
MKENVNSPTLADSKFKKHLSHNLYYIRGIAIVLVVVGHVIGDRKNNGMRQMYESDIFFLTWLSDFIYTFHMPIFFIASGMAFATFSNQNIGWLEFAQSKLKRLVIPLLCWAPIFFIFQSLSKGENFTVFQAIRRSVIYPYSIFWFIHALIFTSCFSFLCIKILKSQMMYVVLSIPIFILSLYLNNNTIYWNIFYAFGILLALYSPRINLQIHRFSLTKVFFMLPLLTIMMLTTNYYSTADNRLLVKFINGVIAFFIIYIILSLDIIKNPANLSRKILHSLESSFIDWGKISIIIYLFHIYFITSTRIFLIKVFDITDPTMHFLLGCFIGMLGPIIIYKLLYNRSKIFRYSLGETK